MLIAVMTYISIFICKSQELVVNHSSEYIQASLLM